MAPIDAVCVSIFIKKLTGEGIAPHLAAQWERDLPDEYRGDLLAALPYLPQTIRDRAAYIARLVRDRVLPTPYLRAKNSAAETMLRATVTPLHNSAIKQTPAIDTRTDAEWFEQQSEFLKTFFRTKAREVVGNDDAALHDEILRRVSRYRADRKTTPYTPREENAK